MDFGYFNSAIFTSTWFPTISSMGLLAITGWLGRNLISTRLTESVRHEYDKKIESVKADLRDSEERFKAQLREKESEIVALRSGALNVLASRQVALDKRRLEAVDQLWATMSALTPARGLVIQMAYFDFDKSARLAVKDEKAREFFNKIFGSFDMASIDRSGAAKARPFLSPMVWAVYSAILTIILHSISQLFILKSGLGTKDYFDHNAIKKLVVSALPEYSEYLEKNGPSAYSHILEALEDKLLFELQAMLSGKEADKSSLIQSAEIIRQANALQSLTQRIETPASDL